MDTTRPGDHDLTPRQREVLHLIERGHTNSEIAALLGISLPGVKWHVRELLNKFGVDTREDLLDAWRAERSIRGRLARGLAALGSLLAVKPVAVATGGLALAVVGAFGVLQLFDAASDAPAHERAALPPQPPDAIWTADEALANARDRAERILAHAIQANVPSVPGFERFTLAEAAWFPGIRQFDAEDGDHYWRDADGAPRNAWYFVWTSPGIPNPGYMPFAEVAVDIHVLVEDGDPGEGMLAWHAAIRDAADRTLWSGHVYGGGSSFQSRAWEGHLLQIQAPTGAPLPVAPLEGDPDGPWMTLTPAAGGWCLGGDPAAEACSLAGTLDDLPLVRPAALPAAANRGSSAPASLYVVMPAGVATVLVAAADGSLRPVEVSHAPPGSVPGDPGFAFVHEPWWRGLTLVGCDAHGTERTRTTWPLGTPDTAPAEACTATPPRSAAPTAKSQ